MEVGGAEAIICSVLVGRTQDVLWKREGARGHHGMKGALVLTAAPLDYSAGMASATVPRASLPQGGGEPPSPDSFTT